MSRLYVFDVVDPTQAAKVMDGRAKAPSVRVVDARVLVVVPDGDVFDAALPGSDEGWSLVSAEDVDDAEPFAVEPDPIREVIEAKMAAVELADVAVAVAVAVDEPVLEGGKL